jgi:transposase
MVAAHLSVSELEERFRAATDIVAKSHLQVIWLLAKGHSTGEVAAITAFSPRWITKLVRRYEERGPEALGDQRHHNAGAQPLLGPDDLAALRERLTSPPEDGGVWTSKKVAAWIADRLGLEHVHVVRGWEALKKLEWSLQRPRPRHPKAAGPEEAEAFKKNSRTRSPKKPSSTPPCRSRCGPSTSIGSA